MVTVPKWETENSVALKHQNAKYVKINIKQMKTLKQVRTDILWQQRPKKSFPVKFPRSS